MIRFSRALVALAAIALVAAAMPPTQAVAASSQTAKVMKTDVSVPIGMPDVAQASTAIAVDVVLANAAGDKVKAEKITKNGTWDPVVPAATNNADIEDVTARLGNTHRQPSMNVNVTPPQNVRSTVKISATYERRSFATPTTKTTIVRLAEGDVIAPLTKTVKSG